MKNILVIADGVVAKAFLQRIINSDASNNRFHIIYYNENTLPKQKLERFIFHKFDPTSFVKLSNILKNDDFYQVMIIVSKKIDAKATYDNIRLIRSDIQIVLMDRWNLNIDDQNLTAINTQDALSNILANHLPDILVAAQNIGLGIGEILEINIPFGSPYVYRHVGNIEQKRWRIVAIYREGSLLLPTKRVMIMPNDSILVVGDPNVLKGVYKSIKREFGQFPIPFGENIYCYIDMKMMSEEVIEKLTNDSMLLHSRLNNKKLIFRVVNPIFNKSFQKLKKYNTNSIVVEIEYYESKFDKIIDGDMDRFFVGVFITENTFFNTYMHILNKIKVPIFKVGNSGFLNIKESVILSNQNQKIEKISSIIFDISAQLKYDIALFDYDLDQNQESESMIEHFENLAKLFHGKVKVIHSKKNPIRVLSHRKDFLQFVLFDQKVLDNRVFSIFSTDIERLYFKLSNNYQLFIPTEL